MVLFVKIKIGTSIYVYITIGKNMKRNINLLTWILSRIRVGSRKLYFYLCTFEYTVYASVLNR